MNSRGTLTLPKKLRRRLGVNDSHQVVAEKTDEGILLRAGVTFPVEVCSEKRLAEFDRHNEQTLARFQLNRRRMLTRAASKKPARGKKQIPISCSFGRCQLMIKTP